MFENVSSSVNSVCDKTIQVFSCSCFRDCWLMVNWDLTAGLRQALNPPEITVKLRTCRFLLRQMRLTAGGLQFSCC